MQEVSSRNNLYGIISLVLGLTAISVTGGFFCLNSGFTPVGPPLSDPTTEHYLFLVYAIFAYLFQFGTPLLCGGAYLFWLSSKSSTLGRIGMALATLSILIYILTIRACFRLIS